MSFPHKNAIGRLPLVNGIARSWILLLLALLSLAACGKNESGIDAESPEPGTAEELLRGPVPGDLFPQPFDVIWQPWSGDFNGIVERRMLRVVVPYGGFQYFYEDGLPRGAVYEQVQRLEDYINERLARRHIRVFVVVIPLSRDQLIPAVANGHADLVAGDLTVTAERTAVVDFSKPLLTGVNEIVLTGRGAARPETLDDLAGKELFVRRSSSYYEHLQALAADFEQRGLKAPTIRLANELLEAEDILELLNTGVVKATVLDDYKARFWSEVFPAIEPRDDLVINSGGTIAWAMRKDSPGLQSIVNGFLGKYGAGTLVGNDTYNRYLENAGRVRCSNAAVRNAAASQLAVNFQRFGEMYDFDWLMLAAQGLQESGLQPDRRSPAGAVGVMQVKPSTAADPNVGIEDVSTIENNVHAAAKYLRFISDRYYTGDNIDDLNSWLLSLAAYNAGPARINRFRREAAQQGYDPDTWFDNVEIIAARRIGSETVTYVSNIFKYYIAYQLVVSRGAAHENRFGEVLTACAAPA